MVEKIYNFYKGYVKIEVESDQPERFINMAVNKNIYIWNLEKISERKITLCVSVKGFKSLRKAAYETSSSVKLVTKNGMFNYINKIKRRKIFLYGSIICAVFTLFISSLILEIEVVGNKSVSTDIILEKLSEINLQKFTLRSNIDSDRISLKLINGLDNISWVGVSEKGCKLIIEIKERTLPPEMVPTHIPCHIVAKKDGIIYKMNIENGEPAVSLNQVVTEGQLLVSGILNTKYDGMRYVHSMGEIIAKTWSEKFIDVKLYEYEKIYTGNKMKKSFIKLFGKEFDLSCGRVVPYYNSDEKSKRRVIGFFELITKEYTEYTLKKKPIGEEEAIKRGKDELYLNLISEFEKEQIKDIQYQVTAADENTRSIRMIASLEEEIGKLLEIKI